MSFKRGSLGAIASARRWLAATAGLGLLVGAFVPVSPAVAALPVMVRSMTWNICGAAASTCSGTGTATQKINSIVSQVTADPSIRIVMIQEACQEMHTKSLITALETATGDNWHMAHRIAKNINTGAPIKCDLADPDTLDAGVGIVMRQLSDEQIEAFAQDFPSTPLSSQGWACIKDRGNKLIACSVHLANDNADPNGTIRRQSLTDMMDKLREWQDTYGYRTIVGGDFNFNDAHSAMDPIQAFAYEVDEDENCSTTGPSPCAILANKLDHIFYARRAWQQATGDVGSAGSGLSDHWRLIGGAAPKRQNEENTAVAGTPPSGLPCTTNTYVTVCWEGVGDQIWVRDNEADGKRAVAEWHAGSTATGYWRNGICNNSLGEGVWGQCNKDMVEGERIALRGTRLNGGMFTDSTGMLLSVV